MDFLFKDIDIRMVGHPVKQDLLYAIDSKAINESIKMIVMTDYYERPFNSEFGGNIRALLFELADVDTESVVKDRLINTIQKWEPRVSIEDIKTTTVDNTMNISINYKILNSSGVNRVDISLRLIR